MNCKSSAEPAYGIYRGDALRVMRNLSVEIPWVELITWQIVALLNQRARVVAEVGKIKREAHLPVAAQRESSRSWITSFRLEALDTPT